MTPQLQQHEDNEYTYGLCTYDDDLWVQKPDIEQDIVGKTKTFTTNEGNAQIEVSIQERFLLDQFRITFTVYIQTSSGGWIQWSREQGIKYDADSAYLHAVQKAQRAMGDPESELRAEL